MRIATVLLALALAAVLAPEAGARGEFSAACDYARTLLDDPIVHPRRPGMSHSHDFAGATRPNAFSTLSKLVHGDTTCERREDRSAYWMPTLFQHGKPVHARAFRVYYRAGGVDERAVRPLPAGLRVVAGDQMRTYRQKRQPTSVVAWACTRPGGGRQGDEIEVADVPRTCGGQSLRARIVFPQCWDGRRLDSANHQSHMAYAVARLCPASHPVAVPQLTLSVRFRVPDTRDLALASGGTYSLHADFMPAWSGNSLAQLVRDCINAGVDCSS